MRATDSSPESSAEFFSKSSLGSSTTRPRIGVFGGAFDPPHLGHFQLARTAIDDLHLETLIIVPTGQALHKLGKMSSAVHRLRMTQLAFDGLAQTGVKLQIEELELNRSGVSYTFDTLVELKNKNPNADLYLIIGADQAHLFDSWHRWMDILSVATLAIAARAPDVSLDTTLNDQNLELDQYRWHNTHLVQSIQNARERAHPGIAVTLNMPSMPISATQIRNFIKDGVDVSHLLNSSVLAYINANSLYTSKSTT